MSFKKVEVKCVEVLFKNDAVTNCQLTYCHCSENIV